MTQLALGEESAAPDETSIAERTLALVKRGLIETPRGELVRRDAHPKAHGAVHGTFTVLADIPEALRHGLFAKPATYPVWIRFSNGNQTPDYRGDIRGMGIKLCQVMGEKILHDEKHTQDFLLIANTTMPVGGPAEYLALFEALLNHSPWAAIKGIAPVHLFGAMAYLARIALSQATNPLLMRYWSTTPYKLGNGAVKYSARPCASMNAGAFKRPEDPGPNFLREVMAALLLERDACFDFMVQPQTDPQSMPIEDAAVEWSETASPFVKVGNLHIPKQRFESKAQDTFCENLSINPWHTLVEHRPLGGINRVRRAVYEDISAYRHMRNDAPRIEPTGDERF
jgi:hypothetical protein